MDPASVVLLAGIAIVIIALITMGKELLEFAALVGVIWIVYLVIDSDSTMRWTDHFLQTAHAYVSQGLATLGLH